VYLWKDPFTTAYTAYEQRKLESKLDRRFETWQPVRRPASHDTAKPKPKPKIDDVRREARRFRLESHEGDAIARLKIPRMHVNAVVVNGTGVADLRRGPGRHLDTYMPGERELVYIAGHRTTYGAWFGKINGQPGDLITRTPVRDRRLPRPFIASWTTTTSRSSRPTTTSSSSCRRATVRASERYTCTRRLFRRPATRFRT
jgi:hypothetical protein